MDFYLMINDDKIYTGAEIENALVDYTTLHNEKNGEYQKVLDFTKTFFSHTHWIQPNMKYYVKQQSSISPIYTEMVIEQFNISDMNEELLEEHINSLFFRHPISRKHLLTILKRADELQLGMSMLIALKEFEVKYMYAPWGIVDNDLYNFYFDLDAPYDFGVASLNIRGEYLNRPTYFEDIFNNERAMTVKEMLNAAKITDISTGAGDSNFCEEHCKFKIVHKFNLDEDCCYYIHRSENNEISIEKEEH